MMMNIQIFSFLLILKEVVSFGHITETETIATGFVPYYTYEGELQVDGTVYISTSETTQSGLYSLEGTDPQCESGADLSIANSCGVHIHAGNSCTDDALGHYYMDPITEDPWTTISYTADSNGSTSGSFQVNTGGSESDILGLAFVIHAFDGSRIACAIIQ